MTIRGCVRRQHGRIPVLYAVRRALSGRSLFQTAPDVPETFGGRCPGKVADIHCRQGCIQLLGLPCVSGIFVLLPEYPDLLIRLDSFQEFLESHGSAVPGIHQVGVTCSPGMET